MAGTKINPTRIDWDVISTGTVVSGGNLGLDSNDNIVKTTITGGGGSDTVVLQFQGYQTSTLGDYYYYKTTSGFNGSSYHTTATISGFPVDGNFENYHLYYRALAAVVPVGADLTGWHLTGLKESGGSNNSLYDNNATLRIWKADAPGTGTGDSADSDGDVPTVTSIVAIDIDVNSDRMFNISGTLSSSNSFSAGDGIFMTLQRSNSGAAVYSDHYWVLSLKFEPS